MNRFQVDSDIKKAETLSARFYTDKDVFEESKQKIFARTWQMLGVLDPASNLLPREILEGFIDEPILFTRDSDGVIRCISNVCTHRANLLVENDCKANGIKCRYHGRTFSLEGKFESMPEFEQAADFPREQDNLSEIANSSWKDFAFAAIDPAVELSKVVCEMDEKTSDFDFEGLELADEKDYFVKSHWALYCENYLEGFHIPFVHDSLNRELDYGNYETELYDFSSLQIGVDSSGNVAARYFFIFPNLMFNFYPWGISVNVVKPLGVDCTKVSYMTFVNDESKRDVGAGADLGTVEIEDQKIVESVFRGVKSRFYDRGRYSPTRELGTHHFHRLIAGFMNEDIESG